MKTMSISMLAERIGKSEEDVRVSLSYGWTTELLAVAGGVSANYLCKLLRRGKLDGIRVGRDWVVDKAAGDSWLAKKGVRIE